MKRPFTVYVLLIIVSFFFGSAGTYIITRSKTHEAVSNTIESPLLAGRIMLDNPSDPLINFTGLRGSLRDYMTQNKLTGSIYFEYLPTGTNIRVDGDSEEVAASLMKIPATMELYKAYELGKIDIDTKIPIEESWLDDRFGELYKKGAGYELTLREAAQLALKSSDNTAIAMIIANSRHLLDPIDNSLTYLDADFSRPDLDTLTISARSYSSFLKCLYFSCYLETEHSSEILEYLTESEFDNKLRAGVPSEIIVAHKIGTFSDTQSDCGIVYLDKRNYVLCIMLDGPNNAETDEKIATISKMTFEFLKSK